MRVLQNYEGDRKEGLDRAPLGRGPKLRTHTPQPYHYYIIIRMRVCVCTCMHVCEGCWGISSIHYAMLLFGPAAFTEINTARACVCSNQEECGAVFNVGKMSRGCAAPPLPLMISLGLFGNMLRELLNGDHESPGRRPAPADFCFCCGKLGPMLYGYA
jgi:hypothetical protein